MADPRMRLSSSRLLILMGRSRLIGGGGPSAKMIRTLHVDHRARLSNVWLPTGGIAVGESEDAHSKLIRAGFLRQAHTGLFHMLPLGVRVQHKIEDLIDRHMQSLGASRVSLSTISSDALWEKSGRLSKVASELFRFSDRRRAQYLLSPTHEEEITSLATQMLKSYKHLPVRLYQITRKYRDEFRPRHGLLRSREFIMKDLYTFDLSVEAALRTYEQVRTAYSKLFAELKLPIVVARASSGDMGGDLSHEYHLPTSLGEDHVVTCNSCNYVVNDEIAETRVADMKVSNSSTSGIKVWRGISKDRSTLVNVWYPDAAVDSTTGTTQEYSYADVNIHAIKTVVPELDASVEDPLLFWAPDGGAGQGSTPKLVNLVDCRLRSPISANLVEDKSELPVWPAAIDGRPSRQYTFSLDGRGEPLNLLRIKAGDRCPKCLSGKLMVQRAIELGHTFHLGTRYTTPFETTVTVPQSALPKSIHVVEDSEGTGSEHVSGRKVTLQMGCYGIGVSRILGTVADHLSDEKGLNWPRVIAPYEVVVIPDRGAADDAEKVYDTLTHTRASPRGSGQGSVDVVLDDRENASLAWKMTDADLVGYPVIVLLGREWRNSGQCEVQCRRLGVTEQVGLKDLPTYIDGLLERL